MCNEDIRNILAELHLYSLFSINDENYRTLTSLFFEQQVLDIYCVNCKRESTFKSTKWEKNQAITPGYITYDDNTKAGMGKGRYTQPNSEHYIKNLWNNSFPLEFTCQRDNNHKYIFIS